MLNIGGGELLIILLVALIFLGPTRLPQVARQLGQTVSSLRSLASGFQAEIEAAARPENYTGPMHLPTEQPAADETTSTNPEEIARAARDVSATDADPFVNKGGPFDLRRDVDDADSADTE